MMTSLFPESVHERQHANVSAAIAEEHYRRTVFIPIVDHVVTELESRFDDDTVPAALLPVSNAETERSFLAPKRLKTQMRSTIRQDRLNGATLLAVHNDVHLSVDSVINKFPGKNRRLLSGDAAM